MQEKGRMLDCSYEGEKKTDPRSVVSDNYRDYHSSTNTFKLNLLKLFDNFS